jgi:hypothetical protein
MLLRFLNAIHWANLYALLCVKVALAFNTNVRIDDIVLVALGNGSHRAFGLASSAANALFGNLHRHAIHPLPLKRV